MSHWIFIWQKGGSGRLPGVHAANVVDDDGNVVDHLDLDTTIAAIMKQESRHTTDDGVFAIAPCSFL